MAKSLEYIVSIDGIDRKLNEAEYNLYLDSCIPIYGPEVNQNSNQPQIQEPAKKYCSIYYQCEPLDSAYHQKRIIRKFCQENDISIPKDLNKKDSRQIKGLFRGMTKQYGTLYKTPLDNIF